jgi:tetratricopeptide (TPR) repeat protein
MPSSSPVTVTSADALSEDTAPAADLLAALSKSQSLLNNDDNATTDAAIMEEQTTFQLQLAQEAFDNGITYWGNEEFDLALSEFARALDIREDLMGKHHPDVAKSYLWVGSVYWHKKLYDMALDNFVRSFRIQLILMGGDKEQCGIVTTWIPKVLDAKHIQNKEAYWKQLLSAMEHERKGDTLMKEGKIDQAILAYRSAIQLELRRCNMREPSLSRPLSDVADLEMKIALAHLAQDAFEKALVEYRKAVSAYVIKFGQYHCHTKKAYAELSKALQINGWTTKSIDEYLSSLHTSILHEQSAELHMEHNDLEGALREYGACVMIEQASAGSRMQLPSAVLHTKVAKIYVKLGQRDNALKSYCKALGIYDSILGGNHRDTTKTIKSIRDLFVVAAK